MYTFRFNPVFDQWVMLGGAVAAPHQLSDAHILTKDGSKKREFLAAVYPRQPFLLEPPDTHKNHHDSLLYAEHPAVGEYELLLHKGKKKFFNWEAAEWMSWLDLVQQRLLQAQHNPYIHYVNLTFHSSALESIEGYQRVGDLIATSHPIAGMVGVLDREIAQKLEKKEHLFTIWSGDQGRIYIPSAPLQEKELWYIPAEYQASFERVESEACAELAEVLAHVFNRLHAEYPDEAYVLRLYSQVVGKQEEATWWIQIFKEESQLGGALLVHSLPEAFVQQLKHLLG